MENTAHCPQPVEPDEPLGPGLSRKNLYRGLWYLSTGDVWYYIVSGRRYTFFEGKWYQEHEDQSFQMQRSTGTRLLFSDRAWFEEYEQDPPVVDLEAARWRETLEESLDVNATTNGNIMRDMDSGHEDSSRTPGSLQDGHTKTANPSGTAPWEGGPFKAAYASRSPPVECEALRRTWSSPSPTIKRLITTDSAPMPPLPLLERHKLRIQWSKESRQIRKDIEDKRCVAYKEANKSILNKTREALHKLDEKKYKEGRRPGEIPWLCRLITKLGVGKQYPNLFYSEAKEVKNKVRAMRKAEIDERFEKEKNHRLDTLAGQYKLILFAHLRE